MELDSVSNNTETFGALNLISCKYLMPIISIFGIIGNVMNLLVLTSKELQMVSMNRQRVSPRSQAMFNYMKVLAVTDLLELIWTIQGSYFIVKGYYRLTDPVPIPSEAMANYIWNYLDPIWRSFMNCSDFIVVVMTIVRFQIVHNAHQFEATASDEAWKSKCYCAVAIGLASLLNVPHLMHYKIVECKSIDNCWTFEQNPLTHTIFWEVLGYFNLIATKLLPLFIIATLNIGILIKMKKIMKRRHQIRTNKIESESTDFELQSLDNIHQNKSRKKEKDRQFKLNRILLMLGLFYFLTTIVETSAFFIGTVYRDVWMEFEGR